MEELKYQIGTNKNPIIIYFKSFKGRKLLDIRKYFLKNKDEGEELTPTKKGISLNEFQFKSLLEAIEANKSEIARYFEHQEIENKDISIDITKSIIGRSFHLQYENNKSSLILSEKFSYQIGHDKLDFFKKIINSVHLASIDVFEDTEDVNLFLDVLNHELIKTKW